MCVCAHVRERCTVCVSQTIHYCTPIARYYIVPVPPLEKFCIQHWCVCVCACVRACVRVCAVHLCGCNPRGM